MQATKRNWTISIIYFAIIMLTLLVRIFFSLGFASFIPMDSGYLFTILVQIVIFGIFPFAMYTLSQFTFSDHTLPPLKSLAWRFGFTKLVGWRNWLRTVAITFLMMFTATFISWMWQSVLGAMGFVQPSTPTNYDNIGVLFMQLLMVAVLPAVFEEFTHRGLIFAGFKTNNLKDGWKLILMSALFFSLMHQNIRQTGYTFYDGIILGLLCYYTGSIFPSMLAHFINNAGSVLSEYSSQQGGLYVYVDKVYNWLMSSPAGFAVFMFGAIAGFCLLVFLLYRMRADFLKEQTKVHINRAIEDGTLILENGIVVENIGRLETKSSDNIVEQEEQKMIVSDNVDSQEETKTQEKSKKSWLYPVTQTSLPNDFSVDYEDGVRRRKSVWVWVIIAVGVACSILSFVWGIIK